MTPTSLSTRDAGWIIFILALGAGFSVASIYYAQPLLPLMGANLHLTVEGMGLVPTLTQAGYALGILFLLPLGDRHDRRRLILVKSALLALLLAMQVLNAIYIGILAGIGMLYFQDLMPGQAGAATTLYTNTTRVGWIIAGSLAGGVAEIWSYHAVFWIALAMGVVTQACLWRIRDV